MEPECVVELQQTCMNDREKPSVPSIEDIENELNHNTTLV